MAPGFLIHLVKPAYLYDIETNILVKRIENKFTQATVAPSSMHQ